MLSCIHIIDFLHHCNLLKHQILLLEFHFVHIALILELILSLEQNSMLHQMPGVVNLVFITLQLLLFEMRLHALISKFMIFVSYLGCVYTLWSTNPYLKIIIAFKVQLKCCELLWLWLLFKSFHLQIFLHFYDFIHFKLSMGIQKVSFQSTFSQ